MYAEGNRTPGEGTKPSAGIARRDSIAQDYEPVTKENTCFVDSLTTFFFKINKQAFEMNAGLLEPLIKAVRTELKNQNFMTDGVMLKENFFGFFKFFCFRNY